MKGSVKKRWVKLTDDDLDVINGVTVTACRSAGTLWHRQAGISRNRWMIGFA